MQSFGRVLCGILAELHAELSSKAFWQSFLAELLNRAFGKAFDLVLAHAAFNSKSTNL